MTIIGAYILPHGSMVLDLDKEGLPQEAVDLHIAMVEMAKEIEDLQPDIIFMTTPHSIALTNDFGIYLNKGGSGSAEWMDEYKDFQVNIEFDQEISQNLLDYLIDKETSINGVVTYTASVDAPLRWGEVVPLWFIRNLSKKPKFILLSQPLRRLEDAEELVPETLTLGNDLRLFFEKLNKKVVILISADMGHTHHKEGPYGYHEMAEQFDELMEKWAGKLDSKLLIKKATPMLTKALCCGYIGFVMLQGMLENKEFTPKVISRSAPTYYGMMVASYTRKEKE
ncbi:MAG: hypothetical protein ACTSXA_05330 [Candidatus Heimdallarchaeota archaeon]